MSIKQYFFGKTFAEELEQYDKERKIPGLYYNPKMHVMYLSYDKDFYDPDYFWYVRKAVQPLPIKNGSVMEQGCILTTPDKDKFYAISFRGDIDDWIAHYNKCVEKLGLLTGNISNSEFKLSDGRTFLIKTCKPEFF